ncbi:MAG TPA: Clp protease N-terminal domain-containing protein [Gemmatimonadaceae bacterium]|nr:Clp protease N-terminal domain-containing protein [Gemmatimonadaceae bacterium]
MDGYGFTEGVRHTLARARHEAAGLGHTHVGCEHVLLGLLHTIDGVAAAALKKCQVDPSTVEREVLRRVERGAAPTGDPDLPYTSRAKKVIELSMAAARDLGHQYVGQEHILLGLIREGQSIAAQSLAALGVTLDGTVSEIRRLLGEATGSEWVSELGALTRQLAGSTSDLSSPRTPEDILLAILADNGGARHILEVLGVDMVALSDEIDARDAGGRAGTSVRELLTAAKSERQFLGDCALASHHILLAYLALRPAHGYRALSERGVTHASVRALAEQIFG